MLMALFTDDLLAAAKAVRNVDMDLVEFKVARSFSFSGDKSCASGSKVNATIKLSDGLMTVGGLVPLARNGKTIINASECDEYENTIIRTFFESELWCSVIEANPERCKISFSPDWDGNAFSFVLTYTGPDKRAKSGTETIQLVGNLSARDSLVLAYKLARGMNFVVDEKRYAALIRKATSYDASAAGKKAVGSAA